MSFCNEAVFDHQRTVTSHAQPRHFKNGRYLPLRQSVSEGEQPSLAWYCLQKIQNQITSIQKINTFS